MQYNEIRNLVEKLGNENYENFIKSILSFEKGINDIDLLDKIYAEFMDNDAVELLHEDFDLLIDKVKESGEIKDAALADDEKEKV